MKLADFEIIEPNVGVGKPVPDGWQSVTDLPMLILVGLTSVGKSATLEALSAAGVSFDLLPDRRIITDHLVIEPLLVEQGRVAAKLTRLERYPYMLAYRERFPGGMGYAVTQLLVAPDFGKLLVFNGLRGENEVRYALEALPKANFVVLEAPDVVRVARQLQRNDPHDRNQSGGNGEQNLVGQPQTIADFAGLGVAEARNYLTFQEEQTLLELVRGGEVTAADLRDKLQILVNDHHSYNSQATKDALLALAPQRTLVVDTSLQSPERVAQAIIAAFKLATERETK